ncbi:MAG: hypothetical protein ACJ8AF_05520 [Gemmatimonadaceae bacterium]|jgi:hypothetical protein
MKQLRSLRAVILLAASAASAAAQTAGDGILMPKKVLSAGVVYSQDSWDQYWEGSLKRTNGNIGTLTTKSLMMVAGYGVTGNLSLTANLPYVWTHATQGVLSDMSGIQDLTISAKYRFLRVQSADRSLFSAFIVGTAAVPMSNYTPDFYPLSIGTGGERAGVRMTLDLQPTPGLFVTGSSAYTFCNNVKLNRNSYYTDGQLYLTNEVAMPNVLDNSVSAGYRRGRWMVPVTLTQQRTLGGGDIRRQDMPFVSNRMDFTRLDGVLRYSINVPKDLAFQIGAGHVLRGRNVGQSTTITSGLFYAYHF